MNVPEQEETNRLNPKPEDKKQEENKVIEQQNNENDIKKEEEKKAENDLNENKVDNNPLKPPIVNYRDTKLQNEFKNIFGTDLSVDSETNNNRRKIMHISVFAIMIEFVILQILCLYLNCCFGEMIEMQYWISQSIAPLTLLVILCNIGIYYGSDLVDLKFSVLTIIIDFILTFIYLGFAIYSMILSSKNTVTSATIIYNWSILSTQTQIYYYENSIDSLANVYGSKMLVTGLLYLLIVIINAIVLIYSLKLFCNLESKWRPTLRSKFSDSRANRYIEMYKKLQSIKLSDEKPLLKPENIPNQPNDFKGDVNKILEEEKEKELFDDKKLNAQDDNQNKKSKRALPKKKKTERDYEKIEQKEQ